MNIRQFRKTDFPRLLQLAKQMQMESPRFARLKIDDAKLLQLGECTITHPEMYCGFVAVHHAKIIGFFIGVVVEFYFSLQKTASDLGIFVDRTKRGGLAAIMLIQAYEAWAKHHGAIETGLGITTQIHPERIGELYEQLGYHRMGTIYSKSLEKVA